MEQIQFVQVAAFFVLLATLLIDPHVLASVQLFRSPVFMVLVGLVLIAAAILDPVTGLLLGLSFAILVTYQHRRALSAKAAATPVPSHPLVAPGADMPPAVKPERREEDAFLSEYWLKKAQSA